MNERDNAPGSPTARVAARLASLCQMQETCARRRAERPAGTRRPGPEGEVRRAQKRTVQLARKLRGVAGSDA